MGRTARYCCAARFGLCIPALTAAFTLAFGAVPALGDSPGPRVLLASTNPTDLDGGPMPETPSDLPAPAEFTAAPVGLTGDFAVGAVLSVTVGSFGETVPESLVYDWFRDTVRIAGAHEPTYTVRPADAGRQISVQVTAGRAGILPLTVASPPSPAITLGTMIPGNVKIVGGVRVGVELVAERSGFGPLQPTRYTYQWLRSGKPIKGANSRKYLVTDKDTGKRLSVKVTASRRSFADSTVTSAKSKKVPKRPKWVDPRCMTGKVICIDMNPKDRKLRWMVDGKVKMTLAARFGGPSTPTRKGTFRVFLKSRDHTSDLYDSWMPFAMFFSGGQAVHYSPDFVRKGYSGASHGCVNTRDWKAVAKLFSKVEVGTKVVVYG
jgi:hypothetical protein